MLRILFGGVCLAAVMSAAGQQPQLQSRSVFEIRESRTGDQRHQLIRYNDPITHRTAYKKLATEAVLDASALKSARIIALSGALRGYFDIEIVFTDGGAIAYERFCHSQVGKPEWAYLLNGEVVGGGTTVSHEFAAHPRARTRLHAILTEAEAQRHAAAVNAEVASRR